MAEHNTLPDGEDERRHLLRRAEGLWSELERNNLGGYSGINPTCLILQHFMEILRDHDATLREKHRAEIERLNAFVDAVLDLTDEMMKMDEASVDKLDELTTQLIAAMLQIKSGQ